MRPQKNDLTVAQTMVDTARLVGRDNVCPWCQDTGKIWRRVDGALGWFVVRCPKCPKEKPSE